MESAQAAFCKEFDNALTFVAKMLSKQKKTLLGGGA
jgi:hypothetical protein